MNFKILPWDSAFFGCSVARLEIDEHTPIGELESFCAETPAFDVCYVFNHLQNERITQMLIASDAVLYDQKVTFCKKLPQKSNCPVSSEIVELNAPSPDVIALAVASGIKSRYYLDPRFRPKQPALYERWIRNCFENSNGKVFGIYRSGTLAAVAGVTVADGCGHLELIAVSPEFRRLGLAKKLINAAENFYTVSGCSRAEIVTQKDNLPACMTYSACGYAMKDCVEVWHLWKKIRKNNRSVCI